MYKTKNDNKPEFKDELVNAPDSFPGETQEEYCKRKFQQLDNIIKELERLVDGDLTPDEKRDLKKRHIFDPVAAAISEPYGYSFFKSPYGEYRGVLLKCHWMEADLYFDTLHEAVTILTDRGFANHLPAKVADRIDTLMIPLFEKFHPSASSELCPHKS